MNRQAFVFYATSHEYAISVLVFVRLLQRLDIRGDTDLSCFSSATGALGLGENACDGDDDGRRSILAIN